MFMVIKAMNKLKKKEEKKEEKEKEIELTKEQELLTEIRDLLKKTKK